MGLGTFHKKKKKLFHFIKINFLSLFLPKRKFKIPASGSIRSCLLIHDNNKLGDLIVLSSLYRELNRRGVKLYLLTTASGKEFLAGNDKIEGFFVKRSNAIREIFKLRKMLVQSDFDIVLDPFETMPSFTHSLIVSAVSHSYILGFDKNYKRYYDYYHTHDENLTLHMSTRASEIMHFFYGNKLTNFDVSYDLPINREVEDKISEYVGQDKIVIINALGAKKICRLTTEQIRVIYSYIQLRYPEYKIVFTGLKKDLDTIPITEINMLPYKPFIYTVALTKYSYFVISVDTALIHIASAFDIPTLAIYPLSRTIEYPSHLIWAPKNIHALQVVSSTHSVKDISLEILHESLDNLFERHKER